MPAPPAADTVCPVTPHQLPPQRATEAPRFTPADLLVPCRPRLLLTPSALSPCINCRPDGPPGRALHSRRPAHALLALPAADTICPFTPYQLPPRRATEVLRISPAGPLGSLLPCLLLTPFAPHPHPLSIGRCMQATEALRITPADLLKFGVMDESIPEPLGAAHSDPMAAFPAIKEAIMRNYRTCVCFRGFSVKCGSAWGMQHVRRNCHAGSGSAAAAVAATVASAGAAPPSLHSPNSNRKPNHHTSPLFLCAAATWA